MKIHRFILDFDASDSKIIITDREFINQVRSVLKLKKGENIILSDGKSNEALVNIASISSNEVSLEVEKVFQNISEPNKDVVLYCSILKKENFEWVVQKATEVGVKEIIPLISQRTIKLDFKQERLEKIIKEAVEQSGRGFIPQLHKLKTFEQAIDDSKNNDLNLFFDIQGDDIKNLNGVDSKRIGVFVGPEGGWDDQEIKLAKENGFNAVSLGKLTLRGETAAIIASYLSANLGVQN